MRSHACILRAVYIISVAAAGLTSGGRPPEESYDDADDRYSGQYRSHQQCINEQVGLATAHADDACCSLPLSVAHAHAHARHEVGISGFAGKVAN